MPRMKRVRRAHELGPFGVRRHLLNSLMSAPAQNVKMFDEASTNARTLPSRFSQRSIRSRTACGESGFAGGRLSHAIAMSSRVSSSTVSRCSPGSGCG